MRIRVLALALGTAAMLAATAGAAMSPVVSSKLSGKNETPKGALAGSGIVTLHLDAKKGTVCWDFKGVKGFAGPNAAHIHKGGATTAAVPSRMPISSVLKVSSPNRGHCAFLGGTAESTTVMSAASLNSSRRAVSSWCLRLR